MINRLVIYILQQKGILRRNKNSVNFPGASIPAELLVSS